MNRFRALQVVLFVLLYSFCYSQRADVKPIKTDPRQFVNVKYRKHVRQGEFAKIWNWENRGILPDQKYIVLDIDGLIEIDFLLDSLIRNKYFAGNFSLEADITGADGTRKIEVSPYSEVGINRERMGVDAEPSYQLAHKLVNMLDELTSMEPIYSNLSYQRNFSPFDKSVINMFKKIEREHFKADSVANVEKIDIKVVKLQAIRFVEMIQESGMTETQVIVNQSPAISDINAAVSISVLKNIIHREYNSSKNSYLKLSNQFISSNTKAIEWSRAKLNLILAYLNSFEKNGNDATYAFFFAYRCRSCWLQYFKEEA